VCCSLHLLPRTACRCQTHFVPNTTHAAKLGSVVWVKQHLMTGAHHVASLFAAGSTHAPAARLAPDLPALRS
jgi:hypothetical protein